jgi:hypothetical protein
MAYPERIEPVPEHPHFDKAHSIIENAEKEIQKECLSSGQPWINCFVTQWNVSLGQLELAELFGEITTEEYQALKKNFDKIKELVDGEGGLREKYQSNDIPMPREEKEKLLELLNIFAIHQ